MKENKIVYQSSNPIVMALQGKLISDSTDFDVVSVLSDCVDKARFDIGTRIENISEEDNEKYIESVLADIRTFFYTLTLEQIPMIFHRGTRGKFDNNERIMHLPPVTVSKWFAAWMLSAERLEAQKELEALRTPPPVVKTEEEKIEMRYTWITEAYDKYKQDGTFDDFANVVYEAIEKFKAIPFDAERKKKIADRARAKLIEGLEKPGGLQQPNKDRILLKELKEGRGKDAIRAEAKKLALNELFNDLAEVDTADIKQWLNEN